MKLEQELKLTLEDNARLTEYVKWLNNMLSTKNK